ncbi:MAG: hypothetical protein U0892_11075 [Pirellulales bacterium]
MIARSLATTAFEQLMLSQDSPSYPCVIFMRLQFEGRVSRPAFEEAVRHTAELHPLLRSRIDVANRRPSWVIEDASQVRVEWTSEATTHQWLADSFVDMEREVSFRVVGHDLPNAFEAVLIMHHVAADGLGMLNAVHDMLHLYDGKCRGVTVSLPEYSPDLLPLRNSFGLTAGSILKLIPKQLVGLLGVRQYLMRKPKPIVPHKAILEPERQPLPVTAVRTVFDTRETRSLRDAAMSLSITLNELIASAIFRALSEFRSARGNQSDDDWLRMMVPISMRTTAADNRQTACNIVSSVFLDRTPEQIRNLNALRQGIHEEMELIKRNKLAFMFNFSVWVRSRMQRGRIAAEQPKRCQTSLVFTNLGKLFQKSPLTSDDKRLQCGDLRLNAAEIMAPLTPHMCAAFSAAIYAEQLFLVLHYDSRVLEKASADELCERVRSELEPYLKPAAAETSSDAGESVEKSRV